MVALNRPAPSGTLRVQALCAERRKETVQLVLRDGLTVREAGERLGVSHVTILQDLRATTAADDAESKQMAAFWRDRLVQKHLRAMQKAERFLSADENDYGDIPKSMAAAGAVFLAAAREVAKLTGAYLPERVEMTGDPEKPIQVLTEQNPAIMARLAAMLTHAQRYRPGAGPS